MSQTHDQQRFTISEVAADWHEPMVPQRIVWPSVARANGQLHEPTVQLANTLSPQSATLGLHPVAVATTHFQGLKKFGIAVVLLFSFPPSFPFPPLPFPLLPSPPLPSPPLFPSLPSLPSP